MTRIAITCLQMQRDIPLVQHALDALGFEVVCPTVVQALSGDELVAALEGCAGVIAGDDAFTAEVIERLPDLRMISKWGIGIDGIDVDAAERRGITVTNTPGAFDDDVADVAVGYLVMLVRSLHTIDRGVRAGAWPKPVGRSISALTIGVIGLGGIGRAFGRRCGALGARVLGSDPVAASRDAARAAGIEPVDLEALYPAVDALSLHCPLTPATLHLLDDDAFAAMRHGVLLVNTARGPVVEEEALVRALASGKVAGAALDVMEHEPLPSGSGLRPFDQVVFGSHNASNTIEACERVHWRALRNLVEALGMEMP